MSVEDRLAAALRFRPEIASLNMGSMNFVFSGAAARHTSWKYDWEQPYVLGSEDRIFVNTFRQIEYILTELGGTAPASSSSATTSATSTRSPTSVIADWWTGLS